MSANGLEGLMFGEAAGHAPAAFPALDTWRDRCASLLHQWTLGCTLLVPALSGCSGESPRGGTHPQQMATLVDHEIGRALTADSPYDALLRTANEWEHSDDRTQQLLSLQIRARAQYARSVEAVLTQQRVRIEQITSRPVRVAPVMDFARLVSQPRPAGEAFAVQQFFATYVPPTITTKEEYAAGIDRVIAELREGSVHTPLLEILGDISRALH